MLTSDYDYDLPDGAIAQIPLAERSSSRLLVDLGPDRAPDHLIVADLPELIRPGDLIVVNDTRVLKARVHLTKPTGGAVEVFALEPAPDGEGWHGLVRPSRRVPDGTVLRDVDGNDAIAVGPVVADGVRRIVPVTGEDVPTLLDRLGEVPLPPYITTPLAEDDRYQTVFADTPESVAAPTAGLHLTDAVLAGCQAAGARIEKVQLAVGLGTFRPIMTDTIEAHDMHTERFSVADEVLDACREAERVIAIGTTTVRALESAAAASTAAPGETDLFISPGYDWQVVDALLTNFHQPRSSLLVLISALVGDRWRDLYDEALDAGYRFLSFGDAMFLERGFVGGAAGRSVSS